MVLCDVAIDRRVTVYVLLALVFVAGTYSYIVLPRESNPEVVIPIVVVSTTYEGVAPADMESLVTVPIERQLTGISGVRRIQSTSGEGISSIEIEFLADEDIDAAVQRVRDKVDQAKPDLPQDADEPMLFEVNVSELPIMYLSLMGDVGLPILTRYAEDLEDILESIRGVLSVEVVGGIEREIQIVADPARTAEYGVSMPELLQLAQVENVNTPAGSMNIGGARYSVRAPGEFRSPEDIEGIVIKAGPEGVVYVRDIGEVHDTFKDVETISRLDGRQAVTLTVSKRAGENVITTSDAVRKAAEAFRERLLPGMDLVVTMDQSIEIRDMVAELENSILSGLVLVLIVIFIFLGLTNAIMVAMAIPVSMFIAFTLLMISGTTLNMVVLFSLILALGMLVDNGIVVVENIFRNVQEGLPPVQAAKQGAGEVAWPITASTLTTIAAFAPMFFWPGIMGSFMFYLPQTVVFALGGSLFVGLVVNPALAAVFMHFSPRRKSREVRRGHPVLAAYGALLRLALRWRPVTIALAFSSLFVIGAMFLSQAEVEFVPDTEPRRSHVDIDGPEGQRLEVTDAIVKQIEAIAARHEEGVDHIIGNVGSRGVSMFSVGPGGGASHVGRVTIDFPLLGTSPILPRTIVRELRNELGDVTGAEIRLELQQEGPPTGPPVNVEISGDDFEVLAELAGAVRELIRDVSNLVDLRDDYAKGSPELRVEVDRQQALLHGLNTQVIGQTVQAAITGRKAGDFRDGDDEYDVTLRFLPAFREDPRNLESMYIVNSQGQAVPFSQVARVTHTLGFGAITRIDRKRTVTVSADTDGARPGAEVLADVRRALEDFALPPGYAIAFTGEQEDFDEAQDFLQVAFIVAIFLIALVLVTQFNSVIQPLIILSSVLLSLAGVFLGLYIFDMAFGVVMTGVGCISLAGVVVNNAIVMIDFINQLRDRGLPPTEAIVQAGMIRFRPVMLTAITTILGLIPMALGVSFDFRNMRWIVGGVSSEWWSPMAVAVIFGLAFATVLTLVVVPTLYSLSVSVQTWFARRMAPTPPPPRI